jgi:hypothetical protein
MHKIYESNWWTLTLPPNWEWEEDEDCVGFFTADSAGALQVSAYLKDDDVVTQEDLEDFIPEEIQAIVLDTPVKIGHFSGYTAKYVEEDTYWRQWWLMAGPLMVYLTYNSEAEDHGMEDATIDEIVSTLQAKPIGN